MSNPAIHPDPHGDVDIAVPSEETQEIVDGKTHPEPEPSVDPHNLDHPEELMGE